MVKKKTPEIINLSETALDELKSRLAQRTPLLDGDVKIMLSILSTYQWLYRQLQSTKLSIYRLKKLFGFSTEKRAKWKKVPPPGETKDNANLPPDSSTPTDGAPTIKKP